MNDSLTGSSKQTYLAFFYYIGTDKVKPINPCCRYVQFSMDTSVLTILVPIQFNQNTGTDIDKTDISIYDWTYWHDFFGTNIEKIDMSNYK
jgi:hypothetical protein